MEHGGRIPGAGNAFDARRRQAGQLRHGARQRGADGDHALGRSQRRADLRPQQALAARQIDVAAVRRRHQREPQQPRGQRGADGVRVGAVRVQHEEAVAALERPQRAPHAEEVGEPRQPVQARHREVARMGERPAGMGLAGRHGQRVAPRADLRTARHRDHQFDVAVRGQRVDQVAQEGRAKRIARAREEGGEDDHAQSRGLRIGRRLRRASGREGLRARRLFAGRAHRIVRACTRS